MSKRKKENERERIRARPRVSGFCRRKNLCKSCRHSNASEWRMYTPSLCGYVKGNTVLRVKETHQRYKRVVIVERCEYEREDAKGLGKRVVSKKRRLGGRIFRVHCTHTADPLRRTPSVLPL